MSLGINTDPRALSSVLIGNIPFDISEDQLKDLFSEVGQIINFRLFCDKNTEKSNGFAFCEYKEPEIAISATRNLGGYDLKGQRLRVDIATSEKCRQDLERLQGAINDSAAEASESSPEKAPEEISKAVASLPPEQMFELMKQMKMCIENNPQEARNLLLQNPQLAYALLQAQVIMRIVDPEVAVQILNRPTAVSGPAGNLDADVKPSMEQVPAAPPVNEGTSTFAAGLPAVPSDPMAANIVPPVQQSIPNLHVRPPMNRLPTMPGQVGPATPNQFADQDLRTLGDQDLRQMPPMLDRDMRPPPVMPDKDMRHPMGDQDFRILGQSDPNRPFDPRFRNMPGSDANRPVGPNFERGRPAAIDPRTGFEGRSNAAPPVRVEDPRKAAMAAAALNSRLSAAGPALSNLGPPGSAAAQPEEQEKAALIMQVLQLTDQQISLLPPEQRQSIMVLKDQLARSQL